MTVSAFGTGKVADYTGVINEVPVKQNKVTSLGLFDSEGLTTSTAIIDIDSYGVKVLATNARRAPAKGIEHGKTKSLAVIIPHIETEDFIYPEDVEGRRKPGETGQDRIESVRAKRQTIMSGNLDQTHEYFRLSAIKGLTKDGKGNTLFDAYAQMGKTQKAIEFNMDSTSGLKAQMLDIKRYIENANDAGGSVDSIYCLCGSGFFNKLVENAEFAEAYGNQVGIANPMRQDVRAGFEFQGIYFIEYSGSFVLENGTTEKAVADDEAWFVPMGVSGMFMEYYAPSSRLDYVGTEGQLKYSFEYSDPEGKNLKLTAESNALMINTRPHMVVKFTHKA